MEEKVMTNLLRKLADEEMETSLSNGGASYICSLYSKLLPVAIAGCMAGNSSSCSEIQQRQRLFGKRD